MTLHQQKAPRKVTSARFLQKIMNRDDFRDHPLPRPPPPRTPTTTTTASTTATTPHPDTPEEQTDGEKFHQLDRAIARRYLELVIAHRHAAHLRAIQHPDAPVLRPRMELRDTPAAPHVTALFELPGLRKDQISVHLTPAGKLTVSGDRRAPAFFYPSASLPSSSTASTSAVASSTTTYPVRELRYGRYERSVDVPRGLEVKDISASLTDGMLAISWPRIPPAPGPPAVQDTGQQECFAPASPPWSHPPRQAYDDPHQAYEEPHPVYEDPRQAYEQPHPAQQQQPQGPAWSALPPFRYSWPGPPGQ